MRSDEADIARGLEWVADDYMTKPFHQAELVSLIEALIPPTDDPEPQAPFFDAIGQQTPAA